ncbi:MAG TPA: reverse transcriptase/maturase family protein [Terriglobia bacterium]|nr:reverse transcriptase/maturase family protein [Terriglobia bacterium]
MKHALAEISHRPVGADGIPYEAYVDPKGYLRWNPNLLDRYPDLDPMRAIQSDLIFGRIPDPAEVLRVDGRDLERGTIENRIVERAIVRRLNQYLDEYLSDHSYGFRPRRSPKNAILAARKVIRGGFYWALKTDIKDFFDNVDRELLEKRSRAVIIDEPLCETILSAISPVVLVGNLSFERRNGLPQGNGVAPFLSNLYLTDVDEACADLRYFRYADDILILGHSKQDVQRAKDRLKKLVRPLGLQLNPRKTFVRDLRSCPLTFLGFELRGGNIYPPRRAICKFEKNLKKLWGQKEQGLALMKNFVRRFQIGPVRKALRRLDHKLLHLLPPGPTLVDLFDIMHGATRAKEGQNLAVISIKEMNRSRRQSCRYATEKAARQAPTAVATGGGDPHRNVAPAQREPTQFKRGFRD